MMQRDIWSILGYFFAGYGHMEPKFLFYIVT